MVFLSPRDILEEHINFYRGLKLQGALNDEESKFLGFLTHVRHFANYSAHQEDRVIGQEDIIFLVYYVTKCCHKLKCMTNVKNNQ